MTPSPDIQPNRQPTRRDFLKVAGLVAGATLLSASGVEAGSRGIAAVAALINRRAEQQRAPQTEIQGMISQISLLKEFVIKSRRNVSNLSQTLNFTFKKGDAAIDRVVSQGLSATQDEALEELNRVQEKLVVNSTDPTVSAEGSATVTTRWNQKVLRKNYTLRIEILSATRHSDLNTRPDMIGIISNLNPEAPDWSVVKLSAVPTEAGNNELYPDGISFIFVPEFEHVMQPPFGGPRSMPGAISRNDFHNLRRDGIMQNTWFPGITPQDATFLKQAFAMAFPESIGNQLLIAIDTTSPAPADDGGLTASY